MSKNKDTAGCGGIGCAVVGIFFGLLFWAASPGSDGSDLYRKGTLDLQVYTAEVDQRKAGKLLSQGKREEGEEYLSRAEEKLYRGQEEKADGSFLSRVQSGVTEVKSQHGDVVNPIRRRRGQERLRQKAEATRLALKLLRARAAQRRAQTRAEGYRDDAWDELIIIAQGRIGRQAPGTEGYAEDPLRVAPELLRQALSRKRGDGYVRDMDRYAPGACEAVAKEAADLAATP
ncbi:MAG: hypothetical protein HY926_05650 [Elusimicrobia bacterium]|nr:hypothetical protein [Elusimicrobiota bacterium]